MNTLKTLKTLAATALFSQLLAAPQVLRAADSTASSSTESTTSATQLATVDSHLDRSLPDAPRPAVEEYAMASAAEPIASSSRAISAAVPSSEVLAAIYIPSTRPITPGIQNPVPRAVDHHSQRLWWTLSIAEHSAATFDAWSTNHSIASGNHESNPLLKPFAGSSAIYGAVQVGPTAFDFLGRKMQHSQNRLVRKMWWVPQLASTGVSLFAGAHNLSISR
jgi:hypothetical protein